MEAAIIKHKPMVRKLAFSMRRKLSYTLEVDDLFQSGMVGLIEAINNYDESTGSPFEAYAYIRIKGAIIDEARKYTWGTRSVVRKAREARAASATIGPDATDDQVADELGVTLKEYRKIVREGKESRLVSLADNNSWAISQPCEDKKNDPAESLSAEELKNGIIIAYEALPKREKKVMDLFYDRGLCLREVGEIIGVSEARISQIRKEAFARMRNYLADHRD